MFFFALSVYPKNIIDDVFLSLIKNAPTDNLDFSDHINYYIKQYYPLMYCLYRVLYNMNLYKL